MAQMIDHFPIACETTAKPHRAGFLPLLLAALRPRRRPQPLPGWLYADLGLQPRRERECIRRGP